MNKFLTNLGQTFSDDEKAVIKNKLENILGTDLVKMAWYPTVADNGTISWGLSAYSTSTPTPMNIKGPQGDRGEDGDPGTSVTIENIETIIGGRKVIFSDGNEITIYDGKDGAGVAVKGTVDNVADLPSTAENGDAYIVKNDDGKLYVYANGWPETGVAFTGPKGADGDTPTLEFIENSEKTGIDIFVNGGEAPVNTIPYATDGHSPIITTTATNIGNDIYIDGNKAFSVTNGTNGTSGKDGYTPSATTATVTGEGHPNSGTEVTLSWPADASWLRPVSFTAWNGTNGKDWGGTTGRLLQGDFIKLTPTGDDLEISVTGDFVTSSTIVGTDQYALTTAGWAKVQGGDGGDYLPLSGGTVSGDFKIAKNNCTTFINIDDTNHASLEFTNAENATHRFVFGPGTNPYLYTSLANQNQYFVMALTSTAGNVEKLQIHSNTEDPATFAENVIHFVLE